MGHLVALPTNRMPNRIVEPGHSAAILFFTGVRYFRMHDAAVDAAPPVPPYATRRGRKRKLPPAELQA